MSLEVHASPHSVAETVDRIVAGLESRSITVVARIDHAAGARQAGLELPDEQVLVFGDPNAGTLLMQEDATVGYELPLRVLVWDDGGETKIVWRPPPELAGDYRLSAHAVVLQKMQGLLGQLAVEGAAAD